MARDVDSVSEHRVFGKDIEKAMDQHCQQLVLIGVAERKSEQVTLQPLPTIEATAIIEKPEILE